MIDEGIEGAAMIVRKMAGWALVILSPFVMILAGGFMISLGLIAWLGIPIGLAIGFVVGWSGFRLARKRPR